MKRKRMSSGGRPSVLDGLYAYWLLDEVSGTRKELLRGFNMTDNGSTTSSTTVVNGNQARSCLFSSGGTMFLSHDRTGIGDISPANKAFSVSAWYQLSAASGILIITGISAASNIEWRLYWAAGGSQDANVFLLSNDGSSTHFALTNTSTGGAGSTPTNTWIHTVGTWDPAANVIKCYVNGVAGTPGTKAVNAGFQGTAQFGIGGGVDSGGSQSATFNGKVSNVGYWTKVLTPAEVQYIYNKNRTWPFSTPM
jgi:hypothetical protein